jgi:hypothetical protein
MALIACAECKHEVSSEAKTCPQCGARVPKARKRFGALKAIAIAFIALVVIASIMSDRERAERERKEQERVAALTPEQKAKEKADKEKRTRHLQAAGLGAMKLKDAQRDPEAFILRSAVLHANGTTCYEFRGKNAYGAMLPGSAVLTQAGKLLVQTRDGSAFVQAWNKQCTGANGEEIAPFLERMGILRP